MFPFVHPLISDRRIKAGLGAQATVCLSLSSFSFARVIRPALRLTANDSTRRPSISRTREHRAARRHAIADDRQPSERAEDVAADGRVVLFRHA